MKVRSRSAWTTGILVLLGVLLSAPAPLRAQGTLLAVDEMVRIYLVGGGEPVEGRLDTMSSDTWLVETADGELRSVEPSQIQQIEIKTPRRNTFKGAAIGAASGLGLGLALTFIEYKTCGEPPNTYSCSPLDASDSLLMAVGGGIVGGIIGHMIISEPWVPGIFVDYYDGRPDGLGLQWSVGWSF